MKVTLLTSNWLPPRSTDCIELDGKITLAVSLLGTVAGTQLAAPPHEAFDGDHVWA